MDKKILAAIIAVLLIGGGLFFALSSDDDDAASNETEQQESTNASQLDSDNFLDIDTASLTGAYRLDFTGTDNGEPLNGRFEFDGNGNYSARVNSGGQETQIRLVNEVTYVQDPDSGQWLSYPAGNSLVTFDVNDFALSDDDIDELETDTTVEDLGEQPCSVGTCRVWRDTDLDNGDVALVKIDVSTKRIVEVELTDGESGETTVIEYSYPDDIEVVAPEEFSEVPGL